MARISAAKFTNRDILVTGTDPSTGEYLSAAQRKALFRQRNISSNQVFRNPRALTKVDPQKLVPSGAIVKADPQKPISSGAIVKVDPSQIVTQKPSAIQPNINILQIRVSVLEKQVSFLAKALDKEAELEKKQQKEKEKKLLQQEESGRRSAKEKQLEKSLSKTLLAPVKAVGGVAKGLLGGLMELFGTLFAGWLTDKILKYFKADEEGNNEELEKIKKNVTKALAQVGGIFLALNGGILVILGIMKSLTKRILKFAWRKTFGRFFQPPKTPVKPPDASSVKPPAGGASSGSGAGAAVDAATTKPKPGIDADDLTDAQREARKKLAQEVKDKGLKSKGTFVGGKYISVDASEVDEILKPKKIGFFQRIKQGASNLVSNVKSGLGNLAGKSFEFIKGQVQKIFGPILKPISNVAKSIASKVINTIEKIPGYNKILNFLKKQGIPGIKGLGSSAAKKLGPKALPVIGGVANLLFAYDRLTGGDPTGAALETISAALDFTGGGWPLSLGLDAFLFARDFVPGIKKGEDALLDKLGLSQFTDFIGGLGSKLPNLGELVGPLFGGRPEQPTPSGGGESEQTTEQKILKSTQQGGMYEGYDPKDLQWNVELDIPEVRLEAASKYTDSEGNPIKPKKEPASTPPITKKPAAEEKPAQVSKPQTVKQTPGPVSAAGNTQIIYKKVASGGGAQMQQPLKTGSATDVPLIASSNPSNFYTMYSQMEYGVVI